MASWAEMRARIAAQLERQTGAGVSSWAARLPDVGSPAELKTWLAGQGVTGYPAMLLGWEKFGYPDYLLASADELVAAQYADRPSLLPVYEAVVAAALGLGTVTVEPRKTYVSLVGPRRTFAAVRATTRTRVDLGLRLSGEPAGLLPARGVGTDAINYRLPLAGVDDVDERALDWLAQAYAENA